MKTQRTIRMVPAIMASILTLIGAVGLQAAGAKKLLVVTVTKGFRHSSIPTAEAVLATLARRSGAFSVDYVRSDEDMARLMTPRSLANYDGVVFANTTGDLPLPDREGFLAWLRGGKAFIGTHSASDTFHGYREFIGMLGGEFQTHGRQVEVLVVNEDRRHPACRHYGPEFKIFDEIYILKNFDRSRVHGLLTQDKHPNRGTPGDYPISWCKKYGNGNVFYTSLGHREEVWTNHRYQQHLLGGILWALGLREGEAAPRDPHAKLSKREEKQGFHPLFDGAGLDGWHLRNQEGKASWKVQNGMLVNALEKGEHGTDLVSDERFWNFRIRYEYLIPKGSNSGLYLRGRYEIQILDDHDKGRPEKGGNGAIYGLKPVSLFASRHAGEWQEVDARIVGNRVSVTLNGVQVHDRVQVKQATGGELDQAVGKPGPIMLQGNHGEIAFRKIRIKKLP